MSDLKDGEDRDKWKTAIQKANQATVEERRLEVQSQRLRGKSIRAIATDMGVSVGTIQRDLEAIKKENAQKVDVTQSNEMVAEALSYFHELESEAWASYKAAEKGSNQAIKALDLIRVIQGDKIKAFKDTGFIKTEPQHVEVQVNHRLEQIATPELMNELSIALIERGLTPSLPEPIPEEEVLDAEIVDEEGSDDESESVPN